MLKFIHLKVGEKMIHESLKKDFSEIADMEAELSGYEEGRRSAENNFVTKHF